MNDETPFDRIMKASKKRIKEEQEERIIQEICNAIGDRRIRDLVDLISSVETSTSWETVIEYLLKASEMDYPIPVGFNSSRAKLEPIKIREVLFELFACTGLEPISLDIGNLLKQISEAKSFVDAKSIFNSISESQASEDLSNGSSLFFEIHSIPSDTFSDHLRTEIENMHHQAINNLRLRTKDSKIIILPLWYSEYGRMALSELGIRETSICRNEFDTVLSVLQVSKQTKDYLLTSLEKESDGSTSFLEPSNNLYRDLLQSIISMDIDSMQRLGSRHACPTLSYMLRNCVDGYNLQMESKIYRELLKTLRSHVKIRWIDSIIVLTELSQVSENRIKIDVINALGNFYHESSISALLEIFCTERNQSTRQKILKVISHLNSRYPEAEAIVLEMIHMDCRNANELERFYRKIWG